MLVLGRYEGETVEIQMSDGRIVAVHVGDITRQKKGLHVHLAFDAPDDIVIKRKELGPFSEFVKVKTEK